MIVPGTQLVDCRCHNCSARLGVDLALQLRRTARGSASSSSSNSCKDLFLVLFVQVKLHDVIVAKAELVRRLVAQLDQCLEIGLDHRTDPLARFPDGLAAGASPSMPSSTCGTSLSVQLLAVHFGAIDVERLLDRRSTLAMILP